MTARKSSLDFSFETPQERPKYAPIACAAHGCPCTLTGADIAMRRSVCRFHDGVDAKYWPRVSEFLRQHESLLRMSERLIYDPYRYSFTFPKGTRRVELIDQFLREIGLGHLQVGKKLVGFDRAGERVYRVESAYEFGQRLQGWLLSESRKGFTVKIESAKPENEVKDEAFVSMLSALRGVEDQVRRSNEREYF